MGKKRNLLRACSMFFTLIFLYWTQIWIHLCLEFSFVVNSKHTPFTKYNLRFKNANLQNALVRHCAHARLLFSTKWPWGCYSVYAGLRIHYVADGIFTVSETFSTTVGVQFNTDCRVGQEFRYVKCVILSNRSTRKGSMLGRMGCQFVI